MTCGEYIAAERTAREAVERKLLEYQALYRQADAEQIAAEQRLATVEAQLAGVVEQCAKVCARLRYSATVLDGRKMIAYTDNCEDAIRSLTPEAKGEPVEMALNVRHPDCGKAADAFWEYWRENGETHKHGFYESTWGAINAAIRTVGVIPHSYATTQPGAGKNREDASEKEVAVAAQIIADSPLIDAPKLPATAWYGLARHILDSARGAPRRLRSGVFQAPRCTC